MYLVKFLLFGAILSLILGEFARFPFGASSAIYLTDILLMLAILFFLIWQIVGKEKVELDIPKLYLFWLPFLGVALLSLVWSIMLFPANQVILGSLYLMRLMVYSFSLILVSRLIEAKVLSLDGLVSTFLLTGVSLALLGFLQVIFFPDFEELAAFGFDPHEERLAATFLDPNFTGGFLILTFGLLFYRWLMEKGERKKWGMLLAIVAMAVVLTFSRSAYLMWAVFIMILGGLRFRAILGVALVVGVVITLVVPRFQERVVGGLKLDASAVERLDSWKRGWLVFSDSPLLGVGFNNFRVAQQQKNLFKSYSPDGGHAGGGVDSSLILVLATTGIVGLVCYLFFWAWVFKRLWTMFWQRGKIFALVLFSLLISLMINSQFVNSLFYPPVMLWYFTLLGAVMAEDELRS